MNPECRDRGSIVIGWLTKLIVAVTLVGVMLYDGISVFAAHLGATDDAAQAATAAASEYKLTHNVQGAYDAAVATLPSTSESIPPTSFVVDQDGSVHLVLRRTIKTLVLRHIGPLKKYTVVTENGDASPPQ